MHRHGVFLLNIYYSQQTVSQVAVLSQHAFSQHFVESQLAHLVESQHSFASSQQASAFFSLLHEQATDAAIAATIANAINTFFMITNNLIGLNITHLGQKYSIFNKMQKKVSDQVQKPPFPRSFRHRDGSGGRCGPDESLEFQRLPD